MNSKTVINVIVFIINILFTTIIAIWALWSGLPKLIYFLWLFIGIISTIFFAFYFIRFSNWKEFMYKSLFHGCLIYSILWILTVSQGIGTMILKFFN
ncbi:hypothetical protein WQ54_07585 [Bacillus sp. SA1-12]|nr:hypothetical protein WQ54_07585 [Bacillus sp. SA1-12]